MLKKLFAILLIAIYLIPSSEITQLLKLPALLEHFMEHQKKDESLSFARFFCMHYHSKHSEDSEHSKLPFKTHDNCQHHNVVAFPPVQYSNTFVYFTALQNELSDYYSHFNSTNFQASIWQPPKFS